MDIGSLAVWAPSMVGWVFAGVGWIFERRASKRADELSERLVAVNSELAEATKQIAALQQDEANLFKWEISWDTAALYRLTNKSKREAKEVTFSSKALASSNSVTSESMKPGDSLTFHYAPDMNSDPNSSLTWANQAGKVYGRIVQIKPKGTITLEE
ncbi:hypothetical protein [Corynebacterium vitaeruminis]|uniref:hypothetical protein n=1 Tax=Corynebacterium vitaeruminis TaxID=38305 RepID=UPI0012DCE996|nr:hypothetical protein [Corynebacterium vitaeruminis]